MKSCFLTLFLRASACLLLLSQIDVAVFGQIPTPGSPAPSPGSTAPSDPLNRLTPQSSVISFLELCRAKNYEKAARYLNLERLSREERLEEGPQLAQDLGRLLDRDAQFDVASLSRFPEGDVSDQLPPNRDRIGSYSLNGRTLEIQLEKVGPRQGLSIWVFSADSVALIPELLQITSDSPIEKYLPTPLVHWTVLGTPLWHWLALLLLTLFVLTLSRHLAEFAVRLLRPIVRRFAPSAEQILCETLKGPVQLFLSAALLRAGVELITLSAISRLYLGRFLALLVLIAITWLLIKAVDVGVQRLRGSLDLRRSRFLRSALPLGSKAIKAAIVILAIAAVLGNWGYDTSTLFAGLGIGGVAIALASQKTIENLFGGVAVITDQPVIVGDFCKFGDRIGTVEDIGLWSTSVRTLDRTVVTVPNGEFSSMVLENYSRRDKIWFHPVFSLRRDTTADQVRTIMESIRTILTDHPKVEVGSVPVRFPGPGPYSLDLEIFAYVLTSNYDEFLQIQPELLLKIMEAITDAGSGLALPTQASIFYPPSGNFPAEVMPAGQDQGAQPENQPPR